MKEYDDELNTIRKTGKKKDSFIREDIRNPEYITKEHLTSVKEIQRFASDQITKNVAKSFKDNGKFAKNIKSFIDDLLNLHYDIQRNKNKADEKMLYLDRLLTSKKAEKNKHTGSISLKTDLDKVMKAKKAEDFDKDLFLDRLIEFASDADYIKDYDDPKKKDQKKRTFDKFYGDKDNGFQVIMSELKSFQSDPNLPDAFKSKCASIQKSFENMVKKSVEEMDYEPFDKYIALNTGLLPAGKGEDLVDNVAKVTTAYEWKKQSVRNKAGAREAFDPSKIDAAAEEMKKNPIFRTEYITRKEGKNIWDGGKLESVSRRSEEYKVNNRIDDPFYYTDKPHMIEALNKLKELGTLLPSPDGASQDYHRFSDKLKDLGDMDFEDMTAREMADLLKGTYNETERYMKGRKSERFKDISKEHFEEALDVLAILSGVNKYGAALSKKLVDRTNDVRKHRWHHLYEQDKVTLEGRSNEATKQRIEAGRFKKPEAAKGPELKA